jgi:hypothetical protein
MDQIILHLSPITPLISSPSNTSTIISLTSGGGSMSPYNFQLYYAPLIKLMSFIQLFLIVDCMMILCSNK